jgi:hypothetical protein
LGGGGAGSAPPLTTKEGIMKGYGKKMGGKKAKPMGGKKGK